MLYTVWYDIWDCNSLLVKANTISSEKSCLISMPSLLTCIDVRAVKFFLPAEFWLVIQISRAPDVCKVVRRLCLIMPIHVFPLNLYFSLLNVSCEVILDVLRSIIAGRKFMYMYLSRKQSLVREIRCGMLLHKAVSWLWFPVMQLSSVLNDRCYIYFSHKGVAPQEYTGIKMKICEPFKGKLRYICTNIQLTLTRHFEKQTPLWLSDSVLLTFVYCFAIWQMEELTDWLAKVICLLVFRYLNEWFAYCLSPVCCVVLWRERMCSWWLQH